MTGVDLLRPSRDRDKFHYRWAPVRLGGGGRDRHHAQAGGERGPILGLVQATWVLPALTDFDLDLLTTCGPAG